jgi:hypothetical protein
MNVSGVNQRTAFQPPQLLRGAPGLRGSTTILMGALTVQNQARFIICACLAFPLGSSTLLAP